MKWRRRVCIWLRKIGCLFEGKGQATGGTIVCYKCKRRRSRSANNCAYCVECEAVVRLAYEKRNHCPQCGAAGEQRGTRHWSGRNQQGESCGGFEDEWFCPQCRKPYFIPR